MSDFLRHIELEEAFKKKIREIGNLRQIVVSYMVNMPGLCLNPLFPLDFLSQLDGLQDPNYISSLQFFNIFRDKLIKSNVISYIYELIDIEGDMTSEIKEELMPYILGGRNEKTYD